jgi:hypothetical protein
MSGERAPGARADRCRRRRRARAGHRRGGGIRSLEEPERMATTGAGEIGSVGGTRSSNGDELLSRLNQQSRRRPGRANRVERSAFHWRNYIVMAMLTLWE